MQAAMEESEREGQMHREKSVRRRGSLEVRVHVWRLARCSMYVGCGLPLLANTTHLVLARPDDDNVVACAQVELSGRGLSSLVASSNAPHVRPGEQTDSVVLNVQRMHRQVL
jgi:hypothetical protein